MDLDIVHTLPIPLSKLAFITIYIYYSMFYHRLQYKQLWSVVEAPNNEKSPSPVSPEEKLFPWPHVKLLGSFMFFAWKVTSTGRYAWWCLRKPKHLCQSQINLKLCLDTLEDIGSVATSWWLTYPSEKNIIVSVGMMTFPRYGKIKKINMFQTNQATFFLGQIIIFWRGQVVDFFWSSTISIHVAAEKITEMGLRAVRIWTCQ